MSMAAETRVVQQSLLLQLPPEILWSKCVDARSAFNLRATCRDLRATGDTHIRTFVVDVSLSWRCNSASSNPYYAGAAAEENKIARLARARSASAQEAQGAARPHLPTHAP